MKTVYENFCLELNDIQRDLIRNSVILYLQPYL
jgi:hypothetical protein